MHSLRKTAEIVVVNILSILVVLAIGEGIVRILYPEISPIGTSHDLAEDSVYGHSDGLRPGAKGMSDGAMVEVDATGFWKYSSASGDTTDHGWLLLGDSVTMGIGIDPDSTFAGLLAATVRTVRIMNPSWIGYSSADYVNVLDHLFEGGRRGMISHVTIIWTLNDVYSHLDFGNQPGTAVRRTGGELMLWIQQNVYSYQWLKSTFMDRPKDYFLYDLPFYNATGKHFRAAVDDLRRIRDLCTHAGVHLDVLILPYEFQLREPDKRWLVPQRRITQALQKLAIDYVDATVPFASYSHPRALFRFGDGIHFSALGHRAIYGIIIHKFDPAR